MPRPKTSSKKSNNNKKEAKSSSVVDLNSSIDDNLSERVKYWQSLDSQANEKRKKIEELKKKMANLENRPENRIQRSDLRIEIEEEEAQLKKLENENDRINYLVCVAKVLSSDEKEALEQGPTVDKEKVVSFLKPNRRGMKRKKLNRNGNDKSGVIICNSINQFIEKEADPQIAQTKQLAQLLNEIPVDMSQLEYCPNCPVKIVMEFIEKPPSRCCPRCGIYRETLDVSSSAVHDKETPTHVPFTYRPKQHFMNWVRRLTNEMNFPVDEEVLDRIRLELYNQRIKDVNNVTWDVIDRILHKLAKKEKRKYNQYYQHVYQITNVIRGSAILPLSEAQKQELYDLFDIIYVGWEKYKTAERSNFMSNAFVLQMCFRILGYPQNIINMFHTLKLNDYLKEYDRICEKICNDHGWVFVKSSAISDLKYSKGNNIYGYEDGDSNDGDDQPQTIEDLFNCKKEKEGDGQKKTGFTISSILSGF